MSLSLQLPFELVLLLFLPFLLLLSFKQAFSLHKKKQAFSKKSRLPPSPPKLPFIGNLHQLGPLPHRSLRDLAEKHGPLMLLHLGQVPTVVVSSAEMAREIMRTHDHVFASRPSLKAAKIILLEDVGFAPYGEYWRFARKLCIIHLLSNKKVHSFRLAREEEVAFMIRTISRASLSPDPVNVSEILNTFANDMLCRVVSGKFSREGGRNKLFLELIKESSKLLGGFHLEEYFPSLAWLDVFFGMSVRARRHAERWRGVLDDVIKEHADQLKDEKHEEDFVDALLSLQKDPGVDLALTNENIKGLLIDMFGAGTDTSYIVIEWAMAELVRNSQAMEKLQDEVRGIAAGKGLVREEDLRESSYLKAVIKEVLRLHPPAPLLLPRESMDDCHIEGYEIPGRTRVIVNGWAICRDPKFWEEPEEFRPERFMGHQVDFKGNDFQFIPFGSGRRICPGMNFAVSTVELALANLIRLFDWELPHGMTREDLDMTEAPGLTTPRRQRLQLVAKPCGCYEDL